MGKLAFGVAVGWAVVSCTIAGILVNRAVRRRREWFRVLGVLKEFEQGCATSITKLRKVVDAMTTEMYAGLATEGGSKLRMLLTFVENLPTGNEKGIYYGIDLGGTNFRVLRVHLEGQRSTTLKHEVERQPVPQHLMTGSSEELFDFIASALEQFVSQESNDYESRDQGRELGFTFSFPVKQTSVSSGLLIKWTKGFAIEDLVAKDVSECLQRALDKRGLNMRVSILVNDTVGTLAVGRYHDEDTVAAVIIGTGTNACYVERTDVVVKGQCFRKPSGQMVINMEWGNFWSLHLPRTTYDIDLDGESPNPNEQGFEKLISGMYLGEIVRRVILRMAQESDIFGGENVLSKLSIPFILRTPMIAAMLEDDTPDLIEAARVLEETLQVPEIPLKVRKLVVRVCDVVTGRAARLAAAGIVGILKKIGRDGTVGKVSIKMKSRQMRRTVIAIEGSLYTNYSRFRGYLQEAVVEILGEDVARNVILRVTEDGSGIGAALLAARYASVRSGRPR
ncbi:hypothetical protein H6P81_016095 [Aristolochia fimbriata]|uniref:Phosphotransferase n=1 Tax=Aristolochia fimbriata TaxID=158543 RepID=A0AAV7E7A0_ARIFI|nr:hypothetical protein H6P81_016095 [Aristolochia fimbriata]